MSLNGASWFPSAQFTETLSGKTQAFRFQYQVIKFQFDLGGEFSTHCMHFTHGDKKKPLQRGFKKFLVLGD